MKTLQVYMQSFLNLYLTKQNIRYVWSKLNSYCIVNTDCHDPTLTNQLPLSSEMFRIYRSIVWGVISKLLSAMFFLNKHVMRGDFYFSLVQGT